ncbi:hypothetical protein, partial [Halorubrum sp. SD612]|uniref:hypothetical protein n=1 Tax=Halorubrum sp. SD612 TaxID=1855863 RepID=UPI000A2E681D
GGDVPGEGAGEGPRDGVDGKGHTALNRRGGYTCVGGERVAAVATRTPGQTGLAGFKFGLGDPGIWS